MHLTFRPLIWTGAITPASKRRSRYTFKASWSSTLTLLDQELTHLRAAELVIEADFREEHLTLSGMPRGNAPQPSFPGVRLAFESKHGPLIYQTDTCEFWQHNVRSIGLGLEALRAVDRYGITSRAEQYAGWKALPAGNGAGSSHMTAEEAWAILGSFGEQPVGVARMGDPRPLLKKARAFAHPDRHDGDRRLWDQVEDAARVLGVS